MSKAVEFGAQGVQSVVRLFNMGTARPASGVTVANTPGLKGAYRRDFENTVIFNLQDASQDAPYAFGNWIELGEGYYAIDPPYFAWEGGSRGVLVYADDPDVVNYFCIGSYHPLQKTLEAVNYVVEGGLYCSFDDLYQEFGKVNILRWANLDNIPTTDPGYTAAVEARMTEFITQASDDMNDKLRPSMTVPLTEENMTASMNRICRMKAGVWMYEARGADDYDMEGGRLVHRYTFKMDRADKMLDDIASDKRRQKHSTTASATRVPGVVN